MKIDFQFDTPHGTFCDALYFDEGHIFTDAEVEAMKQNRLTNWMTVLELQSNIETPVVENPTEEEV